MADSPELDSTEPSCTEAEHGPERARKPFVSQSAIEQASRLFRAIGEPARLRILSQLAKGEMCVTEIAASEGESLSTISQRLRVLRSENLIVRKRRGKHINYGLADQHVIDLVSNALAHATERPAVTSRGAESESEEKE